MRCITWDHATARISILPIPTLITDCHVLVQVHALSLGRFDVEDVYNVSKYSKSKKKGIGCDFSGVVVSSGAGCVKFAFGDQVVGMVLNPFLESTCADYVMLAEGLCTGKPSNVTHLEAVSVIFDGMLAERVLRLSKACDIDALLLSGGSSNFARVIIQMAKSSMFGVEWIASTVKGIEDRIFAESIGSDETFDVECNNGDWSKPFENGINKKEYEIVIDLIGDSRHCKKLVATCTKGRFVSLCSKPTPSELLSFDSRVGSGWLSATYRRLLAYPSLGSILTGSRNRENKYIYQTVLPSGDGEILERIFVLIEAGILTPLVEKNIYTFENISEAVLAVKMDPFSRGRFVVCTDAGLV